MKYYFAIISLFSHFLFKIAHCFENVSSIPVFPPKYHESGGLPMISDSAYSLVILIYVSLSFLCIFFLFCWKSSNGKGSETDSGKKYHGSSVNCPLLIHEAVVIPPTPTHKPTQNLIGFPEEAATQV
uniref:Uncharacterized protein n=1 Tax=Lepeophtheirus salmonis TaxID=72036 RepID=A0A0K2U126_LEPSM